MLVKLNQLLHFFALQMHIRQYNDSNHLSFFGGTLALPRICFFLKEHRSKDQEFFYKFLLALIQSFTCTFLLFLRLQQLLSYFPYAQLMKLRAKLHAWCQQHF